MLTVVRLFPRLLHAEGAHMSTSAYTGMEATLQVSGKDQLLGPSCTASLMLPEVCLGGCSQHKILLLPPSGHSEREKCAWFVGGRVGSMIEGTDCSSREPRLKEAQGTLGAE